MPVAQDLSPDTPNGTVNTQFGTSTAGLVSVMVGDGSGICLVGLNSGVWCSVGNGAWTQLPTSPERVTSIAINPNDSLHLAVGERDGDAWPLALNQSGVWETRDGGRSWNQLLNPLTQAGCTSQAVPAIAFSSQGTLFVATACGIGRRRASETAFTFDAATRGVGVITALVVSGNKVWGRTRDKLFVSANDGQSWTVKNIPASINGVAITFPGRGDLYSLAAFDGAAYFTCNFDPTPPCGNNNRMLVYNANTDGWLLQPRQSNNGIGCDGTGLGGRRFVKAFTLKRSDLPNVVGRWLQLFYGAGQEVYQAVAANADGTVTSWRRAVAAICPGCASNPDPVHADIWDFHISPSGATAWLTGDGGVFEKKLTNVATFAGAGWLTRNQGLHTHHAHTLTVLPLGNGQSRLVYSTSDNDAWIKDEFNRRWVLNVFGDANFTDGDVGNPAMALIARHTNLPWLTGFNTKLPNGRTSGSILINKDTSLRTDGYPLQIIQTWKGETPYPLLDVLLLQKTPVGNPSPNGEMVLLRHKQFASQLDKDVTQFKDWTIEANNLPADTRGFAVSGGHTQTAIYVYAEQSGRVRLYRRASAQPPTVKTTWVELTVPGNLLTGSARGPLFVNPYSPNHLLVLTDVGVKVSINSGVSFQSDDVLTALITGSGKFRLTGSYWGGNDNNVIIAGRANPMATLAHVAFSRDTLREMVVAAPFVGVFYSDGDRWRDLTPALPRPRTPVSSVAIDAQSIYAATEGRSLVQITNYRGAKLASYFQTLPVSASSGQVATLYDATKAVIQGASVVVLVTDLSAKPIYSGTVQTNAAGQSSCQRRFSVALMWFICVSREVPPSRRAKPVFRSPNRNHLQPKLPSLPAATSQPGGKRLTRCARHVRFSLLLIETCVVAEIADADFSRRSFFQRRARRAVQVHQDVLRDVRLSDAFFLFQVSQKVSRKPVEDF
ncbi:MAG: WD40/YVTN/BNR-like repeat-containing protein [Blastocatellia bacterium]